MNVEKNSKGKKKNLKASLQTITYFKRFVCVSVCPRPEQGIRFPGFGVMYLNLSPLEEQQMFLMAQPSLQLKVVRLIT